MPISPQIHSIRYVSTISRALINCNALITVPAYLECHNLASPSSTKVSLSLVIADFVTVSWESFGVFVRSVFTQTFTEFVFVSVIVVIVGFVDVPVVALMSLSDLGFGLDWRLLLMVAVAAVASLVAREDFSVDR